MSGGDQLMEYGDNLKKYIKNYYDDFTEQSKLKDVLEKLKTKQKEIEEVENSKESSEGRSQESIEDSRILSELISVFETNDDGKITIEDLSTIAKNTIDGKLPLPKLNLTEEEQEVYEQASYYDKVMKHPQETLEYLRYYSLTALSQKSSAWIKNLIPTNHIVTLAYIYIYSFLTKDFLIFTIPLLLFYILFVAIILITHDVFIDHNVVVKYNDVSSLVNLIDQREKEKKRKTGLQLIVSYRSYYGFFGVAFLNLFLYFMSDKQWIVSSVVCTIAFVFLAISMRSHGHIFDIPLKISVILIPLVHQLSSFQTSYIIQFSITDNVMVSVSFVSILQSASYAIPLVLCVKRSIEMKNGYYHIFLPALMAVTWAFIAGVHFQNSSWLGLANCTVGWVVALMASPLILIYIFLQFLGWMFSISFTVKLAIGVILIGMLLAAYQIFQNNQDVNTTLLVSVVAVVTAILIGTAALSTKSSFDLAYHNRTVSEYCQLKEMNLPTLRMQAQAREFIGKTVSWNGVVTKAVLWKVENTAHDIITSFPMFAHGWLKCLFGSKVSRYDIDNSGGSSSVCSLAAYNKYTVQLQVNVPCNNEKYLLLLYGTNRLFGAIKNIDVVGKEIWFNATFIDHSSLKVKMFRIGESSQTTDTHTSIQNIFLSSFLKTISSLTGFHFTRS